MNLVEDFNGWSQEHRQALKDAFISEHTSARAIVKLQLKNWGLVELDGYRIFLTAKGRNLSRALFS